MKIWGVIATVLLVITIGVGGWFYVQNKDLKDQKSQAETALASAKASNAKSTAKMTAASKKLEVLSAFFKGVNSQDESLAIYDMVKAINDETLNADWKAASNSKPGDNSGQKMLEDLIAGAVKDLK